MTPNTLKTYLDRILKQNLMLSTMIWSLQQFLKDFQQLIGL
jgi:hypothetical protein